jgi:hypothetical protein
MVQRVLVLMNRSSGAGHDAGLAGRLQARLAEALGSHIPLQSEVVSGHEQARTCARSFLDISQTPAAIIVGGGGGTLRAVVQAICETSATSGLPGADRVRVATLRMGSGNVVAKQFGVPLDPMEAMAGIAANLRAGRTVPCCVLRCQVGRAGGGCETRYAVAMCGLGQFGRTPGDLACWHRRLPALRRFAVRLLGIELLNNMEYGLAMFLRSLWCAVQPSACEAIEYQVRGRTESMRLLAGVVLNFPVAALPFDPGVRIEQPALSLHLIPYPGRFKSVWLVLAPWRLTRGIQPVRIEVGDCAEIRFTDCRPVEFFLDEDPEWAHGGIRIEVAGTLACVPGPSYRWPAE